MLPESLAGMTGEYLPQYKASLYTKTGRSGFFPPNAKNHTQKKAHEETGKLPNQRNKINLHKLAKNKWRSMTYLTEFKITILKKLNVLQENTDK